MTHIDKSWQTKLTICLENLSPYPPKKKTRKETKKEDVFEKNVSYPV